MEAKVKGHALLNDGRTSTANHQTARRTGMGICECGTHSPAILRSATDRAQWHRDHLAEVLMGKTPII